MNNKMYSLEVNVPPYEIFIFNYFVIISFRKSLKKCTLLHL